MSHTITSAPKKLLSSFLALATAMGPTVAPAFAQADQAANNRTATPIKHLVVIFQENVSFDHYFGTYPVAQNPKGEPKFVANPERPRSTDLAMPY